MQSSFAAKDQGFLVHDKLCVTEQGTLEGCQTLEQFFQKDISILGDAQNLNLQGHEQVQVGVDLSRIWTRYSAELPYDLY